MLSSINSPALVNKYFVAEKKHGELDILMSDVILYFLHNFVKFVFVSSCVSLFLPEHGSILAIKCISGISWI